MGIKAGEEIGQRKNSFKWLPESLVKNMPANAGGTGSIPE